jgi:uncharacterized membrane protein YbhN (UPF0104 family)
MRQLLLLSAKILVSGGLLYLALRGIDFNTALARLSQINPVWMVLAVVVTLVQLALGAIRWNEIAHACKAPLGFALAFRFNMIGAFFNQTLPSTIGGDAMRLWLVGRAGHGWRAATYSVLVDRAIGLIALAIIIVASLPWSYDLIDDDHGRLALIALDVIAITGGLVFLLLGVLPWSWVKTWWPIRDVTACSVIAGKILFNTRSGPVLAVVSLLIHICAVAVAWCAVRSIDAPVTFEYSFLLIPPIMLITMLPISMAGWGVREATMMVAFGYAGLQQTDGLMVSLLFGLSYFIVGAIGGVVWILSREKRERPAEARAPG